VNPPDLTDRQFLTRLRQYGWRLVGAQVETHAGPVEAAFRVIRGRAVMNRRATLAAACNAMKTKRD